MPAIKSSSKSGTTLQLFAAERQQFTKCVATCRWIERNCADRAIVDAAGEVAKKVQELLATILNGQLEKK
jgi:hypothetical protein